MIRVAGLYAGYERQVILENVSFGIAAGEMVGLIGPNGAGKSTLLKTMRGILAPLAGEISVMGQRIGDLPAKEFAKSAAYLQQHLEMTFDYSAREVVLSGRYPYLSWWRQEQAHDIAIAEACMAYTGVAELAEKPLQAMSGGQRQRVLLAKVLAQQTPVLFLDEPATGLDIIYQEEIFRFCRELCAAGKTVVLVAHELLVEERQSVNGAHIRPHLRGVPVLGGFLFQIFRHMVNNIKRVFRAVDHPHNIHLNRLLPSVRSRHIRLFFAHFTLPPYIR